VEDYDDNDDDFEGQDDEPEGGQPDAGVGAEQQEYDDDIYGSAGDEGQPQQQAHQPQHQGYQVPAEYAALGPLVNRLPKGWQTKLSAGQAGVVEAVGSHYGHEVERLKGIERENKLLAQRMEKLFDALGIEGEEQAPPPDPAHQALQGVQQQLEQLTEAQQDVVLEREVDNFDRWYQGEVERAVQVEPEFEQASAFIGRQLLGQERQVFARAAALQRWDQFPQEYIAAAQQGLMSVEQMIERSAIDSSMGIWANLGAQHYRQGTSLARSILENAVRLGWQRSGQYQQMQQPPAFQPQHQRQPAAPRQIGRLNAIRQKLAGQAADPRPSGRNMAKQLTAMSQEEFDELLDQARSPEEEARLFKQLLQSQRQ
jgi:hypothetical protein